MIPKKTDYVKLGLACANICGALVPLGLNSERNTNVKKQLTRATFKLFSTTFVRNGDVIGLKMLIFWNGSVSVLPQTAHLYFSTHIISIDSPSALLTLSPAHPPPASLITSQSETWYVVNNPLPLTIFSRPSLLRFVCRVTVPSVRGQIAGVVFERQFIW